VGSTPTAGTTSQADVDEVLSAAWLPRKQEDRVRLPASAPFPTSEASVVIALGRSPRERGSIPRLVTTPSTLRSLAAPWAAEGSSSLFAAGPHPRGGWAEGSLVAPTGVCGNGSPAALQAVSPGSNPGAPTILTSSKGEDATLRRSRWLFESAREDHRLVS